MSKVISVDEAIAILTEYKKNGGENVLLSSFDLEKRIPDGNAILISVQHGIKVINTGSPILYDKNVITSSLKPHDKRKEKTILFPENEFIRC